MYKYTNIKTVALFFVMIAMLNLVVGCNNEKGSNSPVLDDNNNLELYSNKIQYESFIDESFEKTDILMSSLGNDNVSAGHMWLESQGYSYVDTNSIVLVEKVYEFLKDPNISDETNVGVSKRTPINNYIEMLKSSDTMTWYAFENPTHDMENHTAIFTYQHNENEIQVAFIELDVSEVPPIPIRQGFIIDGVFVPEDIEFESFWECMGEGAVTSLLGCAVTNCFYLKCVGAGVAASGLVCGYRAIFG